MTDAHGVARDQLRAFIERIERLEEEKKTIADDIKDVYGEAKGTGFDTVIMKRVISLRKKDEQKRLEEEAVLDTYLHALGMLAQHDLLEETPAATDTAVGSGRGSTAPLRVQPETVTEAPASNGSNAGRPSLAARDDEESAVSNPVANVEEEATGAIAAASYDPASRTDEDSERQHSSTVGFADDCRTGGKEQSDASAAPVGDAAADAHGIPATHSPSDDDAIAAVNGKAGLANVIDVEPSSSVQIDPNEDRSEGQSLGGGMNSADANTGGDHVTAPEYAATHQAGASFKAPPAKSLRPNCLRPDNCAGFGSNHCYSCGKAAKADEVAA